MATVLMGWELGAGLGHIMPLRAVARRLAEHGHRPVFAVRDVFQAAPLLDEDGFACVPAPPWPALPHRSGAKAITAGMADILATLGFDDPNRLLANFRAWDALIEHIAPKLIVTDYAPGLGLAARPHVPVVALGNGFALPPDDLEALPALQENVAPMVAQETILAALNRVQEVRGRPVLNRLSELFSADARFVLCLPQLDPYAQWRRPPADGPLEPLPKPSPPPAEPRVFAYLGVEFKFFPKVIEGIAASGMPATIYLRGADPDLRQRLARPGLEFTETPPPLADELAECSVAVHYGGLGTSTAGLAAGRPQLVVPRLLERRLQAKALAAAGVAQVLPGRFEARDLTRVLRDTAGDKAMAAKAAALAEELTGGDRENVLDRIVESCLARLD
ncbi:MAG: hypothetical protein OEY85_11040 [Rhodospirillales bacterium]|nr:hypothetical protein [Rhodospirillales bacterium]